MSKREKADDLFEQMVPPKAVDRASADSEGERVHHREPLNPRIVRMTDTMWRRLEARFTAQGLSTSAGIRMVLSEYLNTERIR